LHTATQDRIIRPARNVLGSLRLPGDKSISHRYGMLAAFAEGTSRFTNFSTGPIARQPWPAWKRWAQRLRSLKTAR